MSVELNEHILKFEHQNILRYAGLSQFFFLFLFLNVKSVCVHKEAKSVKQIYAR